MGESKEQQPEYAAPDWRQVDSTVYQLVCVKHCNHDTSFMKGNSAHVTENKVWCVHEDEDGFCGHVCATHGELVNRFSFHVQGNNRQLKPGEAEQIAAMIIHEHNSHAALVWAIRDVRERHKAKAIACNFNDCGCPDCEVLEPALALQRKRVRPMSDLKVVQSTRDVMERKLLSAMDDEAKVAILATREDLDLLVLALRDSAREGAKEYAEDLNKLRQAAFP